MSIVGGLVLGDAAVSARFAAAPTVIVVAIAGVTGLMAAQAADCCPSGFASCCSLLQPPGTVRRWSCTRINTRSTVPHALVLGKYRICSIWCRASLPSTRTPMASLSMVFHALRPLCRQTPVEGGTPVKLLRFLPAAVAVRLCERFHRYPHLRSTAKTVCTA